MSYINHIHTLFGILLQFHCVSGTPDTSRTQLSLGIQHVGIFSRINFGEDLFHPYLTPPFIIGQEDICQSVFYLGWRATIAYKFNPYFVLSLSAGQSTFGTQSNMYYYDNRQLSTGFGGEKVKFLTSVFESSITGRFYIWGNRKFKDSFLKYIYGGSTFHWLINDRAKAESHIINRNTSVTNMGGRILRWSASETNIIKILNYSIDVGNYRTGISVLAGVEIFLTKKIAIIHETAYMFAGKLWDSRETGGLIRKDGTISAFNITNGIRIYIF